MWFWFLSFFVLLSIQTTVACTLHCPLLYKLDYLFAVINCNYMWKALIYAKLRLITSFQYCPYINNSVHILSGTLAVNTGSIRKYLFNIVPLPFLQFIITTLSLSFLSSINDRLLQFPIYKIYPLQSIHEISWMLFALPLINR